MEIKKTLDVKGLFCPIPVIKTKQIINTVDSGNIIEILATDIDYNVIKKAEKGIYNRRALRNVSKSRQEKYFNQVGRQYELKQNVRKMVDFREFNLKQAVYPAPEHGYWDIIFCRIVIIYFDSEFTRRIIENFGRCLDEKGHLFLGQSDPRLAISDTDSIVECGHTAD